MLQNDHQTSTSHGGGVALGCAAAFIGGVALLLAGLIGFFVWTSIGWMGDQARLMDEALERPAVIVSAETKRLSMGGGDHRSVIYVPEVSFEYEVDGVAHVGDRVFPLPDNGDEAWADAIVAAYPPGTSVTAYVDPDDHASAYLRRQWVTGPYHALIVAGGCAAILSAILGLATFLFPPVARAIIGIGILTAVAAPVISFVHYAGHARPADGGIGSVDIVALVSLLAIVLPLLSLRLGAKWRRKLRNS